MKKKLYAQWRGLFSKPPFTSEMDRPVKQILPTIARSRNSETQGLGRSSELLDMGRQLVQANSSRVHVSIRIPIPFRFSWAPQPGFNYVFPLGTKTHPCGCPWASLHFRIPAALLSHPAFRTQGGRNSLGLNTRGM